MKHFIPLCETTGGEVLDTDKYGIAVLHKALDVLETLAESEQALTLQLIAERTRLPKTSVFRLLATLESRAYVERRGEAMYELGARALYLSQARVGGADLRSIALPHMRSLRDRFGDSINLGVLAGREVMYLEVVEGTNQLRFVDVAGTFEPVHATALGKALLAWLDPAILQSLVRSIPYPVLTPYTITDSATLLRDLALTRQRGYGLNNQETVLGALCVAVPIFGPEATVAGALCLSAPASTMGEERRSEVVAALQDVSREISVQLSGQR